MFILMFVLFLSSLTAQASDLSLFAGWTGVGSLETVAGQVDLSNFNVFGVRWEKAFLVVLGFENTKRLSLSYWVLRILSVSHRVPSWPLLAKIMEA